jgi:hypothetical protein
VHTLEKAWNLVSGTYLLGVGKLMLFQVTKAAAYLVRSLFAKSLLLKRKESYLSDDSYFFGCKNIMISEW